MAAQKDDRFRVTPLGEIYDDLLTIDAWINGRSKAAQANSLLCAKLQEREQRIDQRLKYLADKRGISSEELRKQILKGQAEDTEPEDIVNPE